MKMSALVLAAAMIMGSTFAQAEGTTAAPAAPAHTEASAATTAPYEQAPMKKEAKKKKSKKSTKGAMNHKSMSHKS